MKQAYLLGIAYLVTCAFADVTYNVVGYPDAPTGSFGVSIDGTITKLATTDATFPLWSGTVAGASASKPYKYVKLDGNGSPILQEDFVRTLEDPTANHTRYDFFDREITKAKLPDVPLVYEPWVSRNSKVFDDTVIATIHAVGDANVFEAMLRNPQDAPPMQVDFRYINDKLVHNVKNVTFGLSGKSSRDFQKMAFKFEFDTDNNQTFFRRPNIKLRSASEDPTFTREKLQIDMLNVVGIPTQQGAWVRLFMNSLPVGLYLMVDDIGKSFLKQTVHNDDENIVRGALWQMNAPKVESQADLNYIGPLASDYCAYCYTMKNLGSNPADAPMTQLLQFMKDLQAFDPNGTGAIAYWEERADIEGILRNFAMEYLSSQWDAYWLSGSNYFMYFNPTMGPNGKWQWIPTDFDGTFGNGDPYEKFVAYQTYADFTTHDRPLVSKLIIQNKEINARFEQIIKDIVGYAYKPEALFPRIDAYEKMLAKDVAWDYSIDRSSYPGKTNGWNASDFHGSFIQGTKTMSFGIKPWIESRVMELQKQLQFTVVPGTPDRVKRPVRPPKDGKTDVEGDDNGIESEATHLHSSALVLVGVLVAIVGAMI
ncbi:hypothetical protein BGZ51_009094 [Haplosporangium sp. Z 767]|nr:hypothetical protein BGZ51_009094 [Haplosporangium sp. Z 767]KAF9197104.1 hypothetical protein BGZ50_000054 [Haplosporangium sp. Z 11]